jgi:hypothetical protein
VVQDRSPLSLKHYLKNWWASRRYLSEPKQVGLYASLRRMQNAAKIAWGSHRALLRQLQLDNASFQADHCRLGAVTGAQFRKDILNSALHRFLGDGELIRNLLIGISSCDQA